MANTKRLILLFGRLRSQYLNITSKNTFTRKCCRYNGLIQSHNFSCNLWGFNTRTTQKQFYL